MQFNLVLKPCKAVLTLLLQRGPLAFLKTWSIAAYPGGREDTKSEPWVLRKSNEINLGRGLSEQKGMGKTNPQHFEKKLGRTFFSISEHLLYPLRSCGEDKEVLEGSMSSG